MFFKLQPLLASLSYKRSLACTIIPCTRDTNNLDSAGIMQREDALHKPCSGGVALEASGTDVADAQQPGAASVVVEEQGKWRERRHLREL